MKRQKGFSLIELLIVVAIILIIAAIAIPNLLKARVSANEASAVGAIRTLMTAEISFSAGCPQTGFTTSLAILGPPGNPASCTGTMGFIDAQLSSGHKQGYTFTVNDLQPAASGTAQIDFEVEGHPDNVGTTGNRSFCGTQEAVVRQQPTGVAVVTRATCTPLDAIGQ